MKRYSIIIVIALAAFLSLAGCGKKNYQKDGLASTHTTAAAETMAATTPAEETIKIGGSAEDRTDSADLSVGGKSESQGSAKDAAKNVASSIHTYKDGKVSIEYPVISNLNDSAVQEKVNKLLEAHAKEFVGAYAVDSSKDTLTVKCKVVSADRKRVTAVYTGTYQADGAAYPTNLFYTNTIDTAFGKDMGLTDYADPYTLAGYVLSSDCKFYRAEANVEKELLSLKNQTTIDQYTSMFRNSDFPYKGSADGNSAVKFPEVFSYEEQGTIYVAIPVSHALGDYALVEYTPDTK